MLPELDRSIADALITYGVDLQRYQAGVRRRILEIIKRLDAELIAQLVKADIEGASAAVVNRSIKSAQAIIGEHYAELASLTNQQVAGLVQVEVGAVMSALTEAREILKKPRSLEAIQDRLLVFGGPADDWWLQQGQKMQFAYGNAVRQGMQNGDTITQMVARIRGNETAAGLIQQSQKSAMHLARDIVSTASNQTRLEVFQRNRDILEGLIQSSVLDSHTSEVCMAYSGATWDMDYQPTGDNDLPFDGGCPRHRNCRSVILPLTKQEAGEERFEVSTRASRDGQVRVNITFDEWLSGKSEAFQDKQLGPGKAQLWRDKKITLRDLLDRDGNALTLEQLRKLYDK